MADKPVLVIEDDPSLQTVVALVLKDAGYRVLTAGDGAQGLQRVEEEAPGLILLDMRMPVMNGWEFAKELRARHGSTIPIVCLTAAVSARQWAEEIQAEAYIEKPFDIDDVVRVVESHYRAA